MPCPPGRKPQTREDTFKALLSWCRHVLAGASSNILVEPQGPSTWLQVAQGGALEESVCVKRSL